ncbi:MAG: hypothetical protein FIB01_11825, partial [Gemmatimonadetes bacterium]|nr:hypothetical protein [Gemmatimonadota bacterium]
MRAARLASVLLITAAGLGLGACAAKSGAEGGAAPGNFVVPIEVENNVSGLSGTAVYISRSSGTGRRLLGQVESGRKRSFDYDAKAGVYKLTARLQGGTRADSIVSENFQLQPGMVVQWIIPTN